MTATATAPMDRSRGLGGSDLAAVLGISKWQSPIDLYLQKIGEAPPVDETEAMVWGNLLEDTVARRWADVHGRKVRRVNETIVHPRHEWFRAHLDRAVVKQSSAKEILEVKVSSADGWGEEGTDQIPEHYLPQTHGYMAATGADVCHVAALLWSFGPPRLASYVVPRDEEYQQIILEEGHRFWHEHVLKRVPPDPTTDAQANARWRSSVTGQTAEATAADLEAMVRYSAGKGAEKAVAAEIKENALALKRALQEAEALTVTGKPVVTWKSQKQKRFAQKEFAEAHPELHAEFVKESSYRVLRITKAGRELIEAMTPTPHTEEETPDV